MNTIRHYLTPLAAGLMLVAASSCSMKYVTQKDPNTFVLKGGVERETLLVPVGSKFTLEAPVKPGLSVQWLRDCEPIPGATGPQLIIPAITTNDVGSYNYVAMNEMKKDGSKVYSPPAEVQVFAMSGTNIIAWGKPVPPGGGGGTTCPGLYVASVSYKWSYPRFGWMPTNTLHVATDGGSLSTGCSKVEFVGKYGDTGCAPGSVTVPHPTFSPEYRFTIYFPAGCTWDTSHAIVLTGFIPK